jgi:hypothetical protein
VLLLQGIAFVLILASEALRDVDWKRFWSKLTVIPGLTRDPWIAGQARNDKA